VDRTLNFSDVPFSRHISHLGRRDEKQFNQALPAAIEDFHGSKEKRARKRRALPHEMVRIDYLAYVAVALDAGLRFTYFDPALPIWDFPIAQRPEIQQLLTPEMINLIPEE